MKKRSVMIGGESWLMLCWQWLSSGDTVFSGSPRAPFRLRPFLSCNDVDHDFNFNDDSAFPFYTKKLPSVF